MIDAFCIFERGGTILWSRSYVPLKGDPLAMFVRAVLLEDRLSLREFCYHSYSLLWVLDNQRGLVFVVVFQSKLRPAYAHELLQLARREFAHAVQLVRAAASRAPRVDTSVDYSSFGKKFEELTSVAERRAKQESTKRASVTARRRSADANNHDTNTSVTTVDTESQQSQPAHTAHHDTVSSEELKGATKRATMIRRLQSGSQRSSKSKSKGAKKQEDAVTQPSKARAKKMRPSAKAQREDLSALDFSEPPPEHVSHDDQAQVEEYRQRYLPSNVDYDNVHTSLSEDENEDEGQTYERGVFSYFKALAGMRSMTKGDLQPVMNQFRDFLIAKNVAQDIADKLMDSVLTSLTGKKMDSMTSLTSTVRKAVDEALTRILTARQGTDLVSEISAKRRQGGAPFVITFCGVNGVGKSTSLAKTCYFLLKQRFKVMIAACDTFRAGAVEQLRTHVKCLGEGVQLFDKGYGKDAAAVAADAIRRAKELQLDVVLVDTAGRMQDNEPLMRALAKLVQVNRPDRIFFVGEALVGNDAVDQLTKFNRALIDFQSGANARLIDGIVLTKFDTIDDKVGAAVSMVYTTGQPIVFVGVGQTYTDLRKVNTRALVSALLR